MMPIIAFAVWVVWLFVPTFDAKRNANGSNKLVYRRIINIIVGALFGVHIFLLTSYDDPDASLRSILFVISIVMIFIANEMPRIRPSTWVGIRTPWTLASDKVWQKTHQLGGQLLFIVSVINLPLILILPPYTALALFILTTIGVLIGVSIYAYFLHNKSQT